MKTTTRRLRRYATLAGWLGGAVAGHAQSWQTAVALPTAAAGSSRVSAVLADGAGGYVVGGTYSGTLTLGTTVLTSAGGSDIFVARLSALGVYTQAVSVGGTGAEGHPQLALGATGTVVVAGDFTSPTLALGTATLANLSTSPTNADVFVARLSLAGQWTQAVRAGGDSEDEVSGLALDATGTAVVIGFFAGGKTMFGSLTTTSAATSGAFFVARLNSAGTWTQASAAVSTGVPNSANAVAVAADGTAVICGLKLEQGTLTFGPYQLATNQPALFVARLSPAGQWTQLAQAASPATTSPAALIHPDALALDAGGNAVVAGSFWHNAANFGPYSLAYSGTNTGQNLFVARLSKAGTWTQAAQASNSTDCAATALALDANGDAVVAGIFSGAAIAFGNTVLNNSNPGAGNTPSADIFVARLTGAGSWAYARQAGGLGTDAPTAIVLDQGAAVLGGYFGPASAAFGSLTISTPAASAGFLARPSGVLPTLAAAAGASPTLAPNPARHAATLTLPAAEEARPAQLLDAQGRTVRHYVLPARATTLPLDLASLPSGVYLLRCGPLASRLVVE